MADQAEVVVHPGLELHLLERRDLDVVRRLCEHHRRRPIPRDVDDDLGLDRVGPALGVDQLDLESSGIFERQARADRCAAGTRRGSSATVFPSLSTSVAEVTSLFEPADQRQRGPLDGRDVADVLDDLRLQAGVRGEDEVGVGTLELGILEDAHAVADRAAAVELDAVGEVGLDRLDPPGEGGILEAAGHGVAGGARDVAVDDEAGVGRRGAVEAGDDQERAAAFEVDVAGIDLRPRRRPPPGRVRTAVGRRAHLEGDAGDHADQEGEAGRVRELGGAEEPGGDGLIPVVGAAVFQRLADDGGLEIAQPAAGRGLDLVDGGEQLGAQLGVPGLDPTGHPSGIAGRSHRGHRAGDADSRGQERQPRRQPCRGNPARADRRPDGGDGAAGQGQHEPARRQPAPEPDATEPPRDLFQCLPQSPAHDDRTSA